MSDPAVPTVLHAHISKHMLHTHTPTCGVLQAYRIEWQSRGLPHKHMLPPRCVRPAVCSACDAHHRCDVSPSLPTPLTPHISHLTTHTPLKLRLTSPATARWIALAPLPPPPPPPPTSQHPPPLHPSPCWWTSSAPTQSLSFPHNAFAPISGCSDCVQESTLKESLSR